MKTTILAIIMAFIATLSANAQLVISNILIGTDYNSNAWAKVNYNNNTFVAWLNRDDLTNGWFFNGITNLNAQLAASELESSNLLNPGAEFVPTPGIVLGTPWTNTYAADVLVIIDGTLTMAVAGSTIVSLTNLTDTIGHAIAGSTISIAGTAYWSYSYEMTTNETIKVTAANTGTASAAVTQTTLRLR